MRRVRKGIYMHIGNSYRFRMLATLVVASAATATACNSDKLLRVERPDIVPISSVTDKTALPTVYAVIDKRSREPAHISRETSK